MIKRQVTIIKIQQNFFSKSGCFTTYTRKGTKSSSKKFGKILKKRLNAKGFELNFLTTFYGESFLVLYFSVFAKKMQFHE